MELTITEFDSRKNSRGVVRHITWEELKQKLCQPIITTETIDEYASFSNEKRTAIKDVGGFVGGELSEGRRSKSALINRTVLTIDADSAEETDITNFQHNQSTGMPLFFVHTTHTSTDSALRLRWVFPLARPVSAVEYKVLANKIAGWVGSDSIDESTDQPERLMFWPSVSLDGDFRYWSGGISAVDPDVLLSGMVCVPIADTSLEEFDESQTIGEGGRNNACFKYASSLRAKGLSAEEIYAKLIEYNQEKCVPPLPESELRIIAGSVKKYERGSGVPDIPSAKTEFSDMGEWKDAQPRSKKALPPRKLITLESFDSLSARTIKPPTYIVDNLIQAGLTVVASPPKYGKSWWCMDLAICVAGGTKFLNMTVHQTPVLYLALEDSEYRIKDRSLKVNGGREPPKNLYFGNDCPPLNEGLIEQLEELVHTYGLGLIIIDTFQKIRGVANRTEGVYGFDYRELGSLQKFAIRENVAIVLVHHLNKGGLGNDFLERLNGSMGISGAADSIIALMRDDRYDTDTKMHITGRDVDMRTLVLQMDWSKWRWTCLGEEKDVKQDKAEEEYSTDPVVKTIVYKLDEIEQMCEDEGQTTDSVTWSCTSKGLLEEVVRRYGNVEWQTPTAIGGHVNKLQSKFEDKSGIIYEYKVDGTRRTHVFKRMIV